MNSCRRLVRSSRSDVLWALALFAASQIGLAIAIEGWRPELRDPRYDCRAERLIRRAAGAGPRPLCIVVLGSSRVQDGFNSSELEARLAAQLRRPLVVFNFGIPGAGPIANLIHFERLTAAGVKPDLLIVEVAPMLLNGAGGRPQEAGYFTADRLWRADLELVGRYGLPADDLRRAWLEDWLAPVHAHRYAIASRLCPQLLPIWLRLDGDRQVDGSGWRLRNDQPLSAADRRVRSEIAWKDFGAPLAKFELCEAACRAQRDLLRRCREERVAATLIWMPEGKSFQSWYPPEVEQKIRRHLEQLCAEFDAPLIDARDWVDDDRFLDGHHLRHAGAVKFTERLERDVLQPLLAIDRSHWDQTLASWRRDGQLPAAAVAGRPQVAAPTSRRLR